MSDVKPVAWTRFSERIIEGEMVECINGQYIKEADANSIVTALQAEIESMRKDARRLQDRVNYLEAITPLPKPKSTSGMPYRCTDDSLGNTPLEFDTAIAKEKQP